MNPTSVDRHQDLLVDSLADTLEDTLEDGVMDLAVHSMTAAADGVLVLELVDPEGGLLPSWTPGAHIDLGLADTVRQYSLCGDPRDHDRYRVAVLREERSRGGSSYVHEELRPGEVVEVGGPRNHFTLQPAEQYLFIAGGIGITPILAMVREVRASGSPWRLVYGGRSRASMTFVAELAELAGDGDVRLQPQDELGPIDVASLLADPVPGLAVYCCGPTGLIEAVESACADWPDGALHTERFVAKDLSGLVSAPVAVHCARSGLDLQVPGSTTILDALEDAGLSVANACRDGVCGSCDLAVLDGVPDHRDSYRSPQEQDDTGAMAVCVSRAKTPSLVLDI
ncbi:PDR/VanB family oxidoreductase [Nocardioides sp. YIM 152315]|uniref:PDR/VanB family oxidoreductase n=1 Tax=Nocardioides sp. YIM 152315 TaxID=3031760 RepID=UPI0023DC5CED|nr:PDR/VanB family oxidoreductase [Nocardioides sp. YIM 152315]MDF1604509.1 PDR/VanB family oxidoreductase [Nocardioides sp. YIM 152315]